MQQVRNLTSGDIPDAMRLVETAGWNQLPADWARVLTLDPQGQFGIEADRRVVATAGVIRYGRRLGWIGMVLTHPDYRGRGFARALMEHCLDFLRRSGVDWAKLDATDMGRPLYAGLGFLDECPIERWGREASRLEPLEIGFGRRDPARDVFGADREDLLRTLEQHGECAVLPGGDFAMGRKGRKAAYFGPCVGGSPDSAGKLLRWFLARHPDETVFWDILPRNELAVDLASELGFSCRRRLDRMSLQLNSAAPAIEDGATEIYAAAGFEFG